MVPMLDEMKCLEGICLSKDKGSPNLQSNKGTKTDSGKLCMHVSCDDNETCEIDDPLFIFISDQPTYASSTWIAQRVTINVEFHTILRRITLANQPRRQSKILLSLSNILKHTYKKQKILNVQIAIT